MSRASDTLFSESTKQSSEKESAAEEQRDFFGRHETFFTEKSFSALFADAT